jgi:acyl-CoA dehydrogenase
MDFEETAEEIEFRAEVREWLGAHANRRVAGGPSDHSYVPGEKSAEADTAHTKACADWQRTLHEGGWAGITWPVEAGGRGGAGWQQRIFNEEQARFDVAVGAFAVGIGMAGPTVIAWGTDEQKARLLPAMLRGDEIWCQLFSEPGAGSDLAGLRTRATLDGDEWIVNGQKVWTSGAQYSDIGEIICRTDPDLPKHKGLTGFIVDMRAPGVEIRPLRQMTGGASFNEVFFNDVRVRDDHRLGDVNQGWSVALTTLMNERASIGAGGGGGIAGGMTPRIIEMVRHFGLDTDPIVRNELASLVTSLRVASYTNQRAMDKIKRGQLPGPELSIAKLSLTTNMRRMAEFVAGVLGPRIVADTGEWGTYAWSTFLLGVPGMRIAGGSDEVMRNIVGERVLGLPKDPGIDSVTPFRDLKVGTQKT